jgi:dihydrofolate reductase
MGTVIFDTSMSLDGFMTAADRTPQVPLGPGGEVLTEWAMDDQGGVELLGRWVGQLGASIAGRVTYDTSLPWWGPNGPSGAARRPLFVVTHEEPQETVEGGVYAFVTDGIEAALAQAQAAAGDRDVVVMGGADIGQQYLRAGLIDELQIHLAPVVFGAGTRMFEDIGRLDLEPVETVRTERATHLRFRITSTASRGQR